METPQEYLARTKSAAQHLIAGVSAYLQILRDGSKAALVGSYSSDAQRDAALHRSLNEKQEEIAKDFQAQRLFSSEKYALNSLCGSLLQISAMAIRLYSNNQQCPLELAKVVDAKAARYCIVRHIRQVPLGLVIYAGRNQYNHIDDEKLHEPSRTVFEWLATKHEYGDGIRDPAFDLSLGLKWNYASNITSLIGWRDYESYEKDMQSLLGI